MEQVMNTLREITNERAERERVLRFRYPWFDMMYNYTLIFLMILLAISFVWWGGLVHKQNEEIVRIEADRMAKQEELIRNAEEQAKAEAQKQKEINDMLDRWADAGAKMIYGIRNFIEKYNYSESDLETYLRCAWNRYLSNNKLTELDVIIFKEDQFLACYRTNPPLTEYKELALRCFTEWYDQTVLPCDPSYVYAELMPEGIYLSKTFGASPYERRWQA